MLWLALSLFTAASIAVRDAIVKRGASALDEYTAVLGISATTVLVLLLPFLFIPFPPLERGVLVGLAGSGGPNLIAYVLLAKAVKYSDLSLVAPLMGLTPLFLLVTSPLIVGEVAGPLGMVGVLLIVIGTYVLNLRDFRHGPLAPLRALARERGARYMLGVAFLWSISANYDKIGIEASSPLAWPLLVNLLIAVVMGGLVLARRRMPALRVGRAAGGQAAADRDDAAGEAGVAAGRAIGKVAPGPARHVEWRILAVGGAVNALSISAQMYALTLTLVPYVIAVKRSSVLFSVVLGALAFGEARIRERALGAVLILGGIVLFALR